MRKTTVLLRSLLVLLFGLSSFAADRQLGRYALILTDPPLGRQFSRPELALSAAQSRARRIDAAQASLRSELARRAIPVTGSVDTLLNAVFVRASRSQEAALRSLPGVLRVEYMPPVRLHLDRAVQLVNAPGAWNALGGVQNAGLGVKIAIIDTGIDQTHPAFQDSSLSVPSGFPKCAGSDCDFTNQKVIVARSYVRQLAAGTQPNPAADSRPDDYSPLDRIGHGTAVSMVAAGETNSGPDDTITGMAPKAFLGNYKVFGSPGLNDFSSGDVIIMALEDALKDGMDIASLSLGSPALSGPLDKGQACGAPSPSTSCDPEAAAIENAIQLGLSVVVAAGNDGDLGDQVPTLSSIDSPGTAPSAISVGATTNSHTWVNRVRIAGSGVPSTLQTIFALFGDGPVPPAPLTAPLVSITKFVNDGTGCTSVPPGSLAGDIVLVRRGNCTFAEKVATAQDGGAVGIIIYQSGSSESLIPPGGLVDTTIPAVVIGAQEGLQLQNMLISNADLQATLDPGFSALDASNANRVAQFSSRGPSIATGAIKPELDAVGTDLYLAAGRADPQGELYSATGYTVSNGTSFSTPMVAGALALVKQKNPGYNPAQLKSAVVNTATQDVTDEAGQGHVTSMGNGKLDAGAAVGATVTATPPVLSFGVLGPGALPMGIPVRFANGGSAPVSLNLTISPRTTDPNAGVSADKTSLSLGPGEAGTVTFTLSGSAPQPGSYEGAVVVQGAPTRLRIPYLYVRGDGVPFNIVPLLGFGFDGPVNEDVPDGAIAFRIIDHYGAPVAGLPVQFSVAQGGGTIHDADSATDNNGIAAAGATLGPTPGPQEFTGSGGGLQVPFDGVARMRPAISSGGVVNAASFDPSQPIAPGSYISIFGSALSDAARAANSATLPLALNQVSVAFDVPSANISVPGRLYYVSPNQVNVQVPWELRGQKSALMKVNLGFTSGNLYTLTLADYSPAVFTYQDGSSLSAAALDTGEAVISRAHPAQRGQTIEVYANGLGPVDQTPQTGEPSPAQPLARTIAGPVVTIGGQSAPVSFSGLAPGFSGLYQLNVTVPSGVSPGNQPLVISIGGSTSPAVNIPVQ